MEKREKQRIKQKKKHKSVTVAGVGVLAALALALTLFLNPNDTENVLPKDISKTQLPGAIQEIIVGGDGEKNDIAAPQLQWDKQALASYDTKAGGWGQGNAVDEKNRPSYAVSTQEKYGKYNADFIAPYSEKVYLTLDEGYENGYTAQILDVLKEKNCPAVFFVTMPYVKSNPDLIKRMIDEGHVVGAHSVTHPANGMPSLSLEEQANEIIQLHQYVKEQFGYDMYLFRFPAGIYSEQSLALLQQLGYRSVFWSFAYRDWETDNQPDPAESLVKLNNKLHGGAIYLLHAVSATNTQIMGQFIDQTRAAGYCFATYPQVFE